MAVVMKTVRTYTCSSKIECVCERERRRDLRVALHIGTERRFVSAILRCVKRQIQNIPIGELVTAVERLIQRQCI